ncbi:MAG: hypothetical protein M1820_010455 [Bogoriella megaspora]|nr:MAG: hypothetical protein M1820_010455 [Bogoriella megaspora]
MPLGFERLNERTQRPNALINFIKPLPGDTFATAHDFLSRIAAIVLPIMKQNYIAVMSLEEYPANPEFAGRNFNAGEVIQLVLRTRSGAWLPFRSVQMVMVHELAHCKQMNHSKYFWGVRNQYAGELRELWGKGYIGEGMWGRGRPLENVGWVGEGRMAPEEEPRSLCGGTFRSGRGRKRKRAGGKKEGEKLSYAEKQQRRIRRKFGEGGQALGNDEVVRFHLEKGKMGKGKPRVAGSARGRELRAAAALARFDQAKEEQVKEELNEQVKHEQNDSVSETESEAESLDEGQEAIDQNGQRIMDQNGRGMIKVCEDEDQDDINVKREMDEIHEMSDWRSLPPAPTKPTKRNADIQARTTPREHKKESSAQKRPLHKNDARSREAPSEQELSFNTRSGLSPPDMQNKIRQEDDKEQTLTTIKAEVPEGNALNQDDSKDVQSRTNTASVCPVCSLENDATSLTCIACANVLDLQRVPNHWRCQSPACRGSSYVNAGDSGVCGACGASKRDVKG